MGRWVAAVVLAGCYQPAFPNGAACSSDGDCPADQPCVDRVCGGTANQSDAPPADASVKTDAPPDGTDLPQQVTILLGDDPNELVDTELFMDNPATGSQNHLSIDSTETALIRFDLSSISTSATVISAKLIVRTFDAASTDGGTVLVHRMRQSWEEATATWDMRNATQAWTTAGALPPSSDAGAIADLRPSAINTDYDVELPVGMIQDWVATPSTNFGISIVRGTSIEHIHLRSRENAPNSRLELVIQQ